MTELMQRLVAESKIRGNEGDTDLASLLLDAHRCIERLETDCRISTDALIAYGRGRAVLVDRSNTNVIDAGVAACLNNPWFSFDIDVDGLLQSGLVEDIYRAMRSTELSKPRSGIGANLQAAIDRALNELAMR